MNITLKNRIKIFFLINIFSAVLLSKAATIENFQFTDVNGKNYDLYTLLNNGKALYVQMMFSG